MIINDFNTNTIPFCVITDWGDMQGATPRRNENDTIYGANGRYDLLDGAYDGYERTLTFYVAKLTDIAKIVEHFQDKDNVIEFSYQLGSIYYCDFLESSYEMNGHHAWNVKVKLYMKPFRYQKEVLDVILNGNGTITNPGTIYSEPIILIEGSGEVSLTIGKQTMILNIIDRAKIDCRHLKQNIYDQNGNVKNTLRKRGPFFEIPVGRTGISLSGNVRKLTIQGNWRYKI